ncbi:MAG: hypothetical protein ACRDD1_20465, partial [Planctomycetia bacterium]
RSSRVAAGVPTARRQRSRIHHPRQCQSLNDPALRPAAWSILADAGGYVMTTTQLSSPFH